MNKKEIEKRVEAVISDFEVSRTFRVIDPKLKVEFTNAIEQIIKEEGVKVLETIKLYKSYTRKNEKLDAYSILEEIEYHLKDSKEDNEAKLERELIEEMIKEDKPSAIDETNEKIGR